MNRIGEFNANSGVFNSYADNQRRSFDENH